MAFKFTKAQEKRFHELLDAATLAAQELSSFVSDEIVDPLRAEYDDKTEKWQASDAGQETESWLSQWEAFNDELPEFNEFPSMSAGE